jgi:hypothetical protein
MADSKISALPASTTPLAGTEVLPIVQSSTTRQVSVANLTAGRAISATSVTASTGSFVVGTSGQGVDFSATPGTGTSELLADYEEGTWTPIDGSGAGLTFTVTNATYTKIGRMVTCQLQITYPVTANTNGARIDGLPFTPATNINSNGYLGSTAAVGIAIQTAGSTNTNILNAIGAGAVNNATLSGTLVYGIFTYFA